MKVIFTKAIRLYSQASNPLTSCSPKQSKRHLQQTVLCLSFLLDAPSSSLPLLCQAHPCILLLRVPSFCKVFCQLFPMLLKNELGVVCCKPPTHASLPPWPR